MSAELAMHAFDVVSAGADALPYVLNAWGRYVENNLEATPQQGFLKAFAQHQARIIRRSEVLLAMDAGRIVGFCVFERGSWATITGVDHETKTISLGGAGKHGVLHWIATRDKRRQQGAARALLATAGLRKDRTEISAWTPSLRHLGLATAPYTPFWLRS